MWKSEFVRSLELCCVKRRSLGVWKMSSNQQIPTSTPVKYAVESSSSYGSSSSNNLPLPSPSLKLSPGKRFELDEWAAVAMITKKAFAAIQSIMSSRELKTQSMDELSPHNFLLLHLPHLSFSYFFHHIFSNSNSRPPRLSLSLSLVSTTHYLSLIELYAKCLTSLEWIWWWLLWQSTEKKTKTLFFVYGEFWHCSIVCFFAFDIIFSISTRLLTFASSLPFYLYHIVESRLWSSRVIETKSPSSQAQFNRQFARLVQSIAESRWIELWQYELSLKQKPDTKHK